MISSYLLLQYAPLTHKRSKSSDFPFEVGFDFCEAQGKGRAKGRPRKVTQRSFIDGGWWISFSLMLYIKFGWHHHQKSLNLQD